MVGTVQDPIKSIRAFSHALPLIPDEGTDSIGPCEAIWVGLAGSLRVDMANGDLAVSLSVPAGLLHLRVTKVYAIGTSADLLVQLW